MLKMPEWSIAILGIVVGFALNEFSTIIRQRTKRAKAKDTLWDELNSIRFQLDQKADIANQVQSAISQGRMLPGKSVPFPSTAFMSCFPLIIDTLTPIERDNIRHIYSMLAVLDDFMDRIEDSFKADSAGDVVEDAKRAYIDKLDDVVNTYGTTRLLIESLLSGNATDIFGRSKEK